MAQIQDWTCARRKCAGINFAVAFACAVTRKTSEQEDLVARNGNLSIFSTYKTIFPEVLAKLQEKSCKRVIACHLSGFPPWIEKKF
jgi:hypothetical protein